MLEKGGARVRRGERFGKRVEGAVLFGGCCGDGNGGGLG